MNTARSATWTLPGVDKGELSTVELSNLRLLIEARLVLVGVAAVMAVLHASTPAGAAVAGLLAGYALLAARELKRVRRTPHASLLLNHWTDLGCYLAIAAVTGGLSSPYTVFLLFPIFTACVRSGVRLGLVVALLCAAVLAGMASIPGPLSPAAVFRDIPLAPLALGLVLAIVIARWAHIEITTVRRLAFCNDVSQVFTPQHDLRSAVTAFCEMLCAYYHAANCMVLLKDNRSGGWLLFEVGGIGKRVRGEPMDAALVEPLLVIPADRCVLYRALPAPGRRQSCVAYDATTLQPVPELDCGAAAGLAQLLEAGSLVSLPLKSRSQVIGRLHLTARSVSYGRDDMQFLAQVAAQVGLLIENVQLVERLTMEVANEERKKISRDLHDGTIQPYIGLKLALEALQRKVVADPILVHEVDDLIKMASDGIAQLRHYVGNLKSADRRSRLDTLVPAIRRQAEKFSEYYGIATEVVAEGDVPVPGGLFDEVMHLVREALSNIRRHTRSSSARIEVEAGEGRLRLSFANEAEPDNQPAPFFPRSLSERATELGGRVHVDLARRGATVVSIELPL